MKRVICLLLILSVLCATWLLASCEKTPEFSPSDGATSGVDPASGASDPSGASGSSGASDPSGGTADPAEKARILAEWQSKYTAGGFGIVDSSNPFVVMEIEGYGSIRLELFPSYAPISVENFLKYVNDGFYDGVVFHRVIKNFMIQAGGFVESEGVVTSKNATYGEIKGEFVDNGVANYIGHFPGILSMARKGKQEDAQGNVIDDGYDSGSSEFFICSTRAYWLDGQYAAFGRVIDEESMDVVYAIEKVETTTRYLYYGNTPARAADVPVSLPKITRAYAI